jgi:glycosyltransferase involved in cell wall biosynthesis
VTRAIDAAIGAGEWPAATRLLRPAGEVEATYAHLPVQAVGRRGGQAWEQLELPRQARGALLLSLGNTAPLLAGRRQAVVIHDAGVFDTPESYSWQFRAWYRLLHHGLARGGAKLLTVSEFSRARLAARLRLDPARIGVLPEGGEHILRAPADAGILTRHKLRPGGYALAVGNPAAHKNLSLLQAAAGLLAERGLTLALAGAADAAVFRSTSGGPAAVALGRVSDAELRSLYEQALCLVFPSRYEGFGLPPLEAMVCGCPVLAARSGAVPEVCGDAALWFDAAGPESLTAALGRLMEEQDLAPRLRQAGLERAALFTWPRAAAALRSHLEALAR